ncbi:GPW/gp25 family protein [Hoeflea ulvae]|uniref:GPW/gp25 family protein n=1 Tax=Hoeflea ulvae TaxID=2983764 RepID=A0ABT3YLX3_9HYPH|nr:GPW/gp25 family protein [Hoeflea ulvae]MCY0096587.1 GPW/gp25 family protein [Hoeflea ulvae]
MSLPDPINAPGAYLGFPLRISGDGARQSGRKLHLKELVIQSLLTAAGERVFVPNFGIGIQRFVFAPMTENLWERIENRLIGDLSEILRGDADTNSISVSARPDAGQSEILRVVVRYRLIAIDREDSVELAISGDDMMSAETTQKELR